MISIVDSTSYVCSLIAKRFLKLSYQERKIVRRDLNCMVYYFRSSARNMAGRFLIYLFPCTAPHTLIHYSENSSKISVVINEFLLKHEKISGDDLKLLEKETDEAIKSYQHSRQNANKLESVNANNKTKTNEVSNCYDIII